MSLNTKDYENLLNFSCELNRTYLPPYEYSLKLISKYFNYTNIAFFPENTNTTSINDINRVYYTNFFSINLDINFIKEFKEKYYKHSIFQPLNLPEKLLNNTTISIEDIMPYNNFIHTENSQFLNKYNFNYRLNINLSSGSNKVGTLCIFKSKEDGNFTEKEIKISEILSNILSTYYINFFNLYNSLFKENIFGKGYDYYSDGVIIWNNKYTILKANKKAREFSCEISESLNARNDSMHNTFIKINPALSSIQKSIYFLGRKLIQNTNNQHLTISCNKCTYTIKTSIIITPEIAGTMETTYFTYITKSLNLEACSLNKTKTFYNLTERELEIVNLIKEGFSNKDISTKLYLSNNTVKTHVNNIFKKLNVNNRTSLLNKISLLNKNSHNNS